MVDEIEMYVQHHQMLSLQQAAKMFNVSPVTFRKWMEQGNIPHFKVERTCRIAIRDLEDFRKQNIFLKKGEP